LELTLCAADISSQFGNLLRAEDENRENDQNCYLSGAECHVARLSLMHPSLKCFGMPKSEKFETRGKRASG
jgi:hypothetical protein